jgi:hypothetical protein
MPASLEIIVGLFTLVGAGCGVWLWDKPRRDGARLENYLRERRTGYKRGRYPNYQQTEFISNASLASTQTNS